MNKRIRRRGGVVGRGASTTPISSTCRCWQLPRYPVCDCFHVGRDCGLRDNDLLARRCWRAALGSAQRLRFGVADRTRLSSNWIRAPRAYARSALSPSSGSSALQLCPRARPLGLVPSEQSSGPPRCTVEGRSALLRRPLWEGLTGLDAAPLDREFDKGALDMSETERVGITPKSWTAQRHHGMLHLQARPCK